MKIIRNNDLHELITKSGGKFNVDSLDEAYKFCEKIAKSHYENFPVGSILIPKKIRKYVYSIYAFSRIADDIADEINANIDYKIQCLNDYQKLLNDFSILNSGKGNPLILAVQNTIKKFNIPANTLEKLITAFKMDVNFKNPSNFEDLLNYCEYSANPVGELILRLFQEWTEENQLYSDKICSSLQLINFWQDLSVDLKKKRIYIPDNLLKKYEITFYNDKLIYDNKNLSLCLNELFEFTEKLMVEASILVNHIKNYRLKYEIKLTMNMALIVLRKSKKLNIRLLEVRPKLNKFDYLKVLFYR